MPNELKRMRAGNSTAVLTVIVVVAVLYFARVVIMPIALAILITFLLAPLVIRLRRLGVGRITAALAVICFSGIVLTVVTGALTLQLGELAQRIPEYETNVRKKLDAIRKSSMVNRFTSVMKNINKELKPAPDAAPTEPGEERPVPVQISADPITPLQMVQSVVGPIVHLAITATLVTVFVIFMLIQREDLRDRIIRLAGEARVNATTQVLDDAATRVSRYLVAQLLLNVAFGVIVGVGLYLIGIPNPMLWALLAAVLRYVPYLGIWVGALLPVMVAFAVEPGWVKVPTIFALYFLTDVLVINFAEPVLFGTSTGVSPIAILIAAVFWTWLWGPVGLLLATPLTVCVVVLGRHSPSLHFLSVMLSDEKVLAPETRFYQRMLAMDLDEATEIAEEYLRGHTLDQLYDLVIVPALQLAEEERHRGMLDEGRQKFMMQNTRLLIEDVGDRVEELAGPAVKGDATTAAVEKRKEPKREGDSLVLCVPARDDADALAAQMLAQLLTKRGISAKALAGGGLASEALEVVGKEKAKIACVTAIPPYGYMHARYVCRRIQNRFKDVHLLATVLTEGGVSELRNRQPQISADGLAASLKEAVASITSFMPVANQGRERMLNAA